MSFRSPTWCFRIVLAIGLLTATVFGIARHEQAAAATAHLHLRPNDGPVGASVLARGRGFPSQTQGTVVWVSDDTVLARFTADASGAFQVPIVIPRAAVGEYRVVAQAAGVSASDEFAIEPAEATAAPTTATSAPSVGSVATVGSTVPAAASAVAGPICPPAQAQDIAVTNAAELTAALAKAKPGDVIRLADGRYQGNFTIAVSGTADARIVLCGSRNAIIDGGDPDHGYALHITANYWTINGITVTNAQKGIMLDGANFTILGRIAVHEIGDEGVHFRTNSSDNVIQDSDVFATGRRKAKFGEGVYLGSAVSNWPKYTDGNPDHSDRNRVLRNHIWQTTAENIDIKEGTTGGLIEGNILDGAGLTGADSWVDVKGNDYTIRGNTGTTSPEDGFQTHVINNMDWGQNNVFARNVAKVDSSGYGFYIHNGEETGNIVRCDNKVSGAEKGVSNIPCT